MRANLLPTTPALESAVMGQDHSGQSDGFENYGSVNETYLQLAHSTLATATAHLVVSG
jgi:hypothetical protein